MSKLPRRTVITILVFSTLLVFACTLTLTGHATLHCGDYDVKAEIEGGLFTGGSCVDEVLTINSTVGDITVSSDTDGNLDVSIDNNGFNCVQPTDDGWECQSTEGTTIWVDPYTPPPDPNVREL